MDNGQGHGKGFGYSEGKAPQLGLTLIELAVILVVLGILVGVGASLIGVLIKQSKYRQSQESVRRVVYAVEGRILETRQVPQNPFSFTVSKDAFGNDIYYVYATDNGTPIDVCNATETTLRLCINDTNNCTNNVIFAVLAKGSNYNLQSDIPAGGTYQAGGVHGLW